MTLVKDKAIVLRKLDFSETSQVLVIFGREHGQHHVIAKGIKRGTKSKAGTGIDLLEMGHAVFTLRPGKEQNLSQLTEWVQADHFPHLRANLLSNYAAQYAAEITSQLTEINDPHPELFDALATSLDGLKTSEPVAALVAFLLSLLEEIGLGPSFDRCTSCQREISNEPVVFFSSRQGGAICRDCEPAIVEKRRVQPTLMAALTETTSLSSNLVRPAFELLDYHLREIMYKPARLSSLLRAAMGMQPAT